MNKYQEEYLVKIVRLIGDFGLEAAGQWARDRGLGYLVCEALDRFKRGE